MTTETRSFRAGTLRQAIADRTSQALACGALQPIHTTQRVLEEGGVRFVVRMVSSLARKEAARQRQGRGPTARTPSANPFLPYDPDLFVADLSGTHVGLLNKFQVIDHHLLIVTRHFESQERRLTRADFEALWIGLTALGGLGFYNGGEAAGASQRHKHLQIVPVQLAGQAPGLPIEPLLAALPPRGEIGRIPHFPFQHAALRLKPSTPRSLRERARAAHRRYLDLLRATGFPAGKGPRLLGAYNLLVTLDWMLLVPRSKESFAGISINALGFAGSLFVRDPAQMRRIQDQGPWKVLAEVGVPAGKGPARAGAPSRRG